MAEGLCGIIARFAVATRVERRDDARPVAKWSMMLAVILRSRALESENRFALFACADLRFLSAPAWPVLVVARSNRKTASHFS